MQLIEISPSILLLITSLFFSVAHRSSGLAKNTPDLAKSPIMPSERRRVAIVTGSNKGIGYYTAIRLASCGLFSDVVMACRDEVRGRVAVEEVIRQLDRKKINSCRVIYMPLLVGDVESHREFRDMLQEQFDGTINVLVNNAAIAFKARDPTPFPEQAKPTLDINFRGTVDLTQQLLPLLRRGNDARIVNMCSLAGKLSQIRSDELRNQFSAPDLTIEKLQSLVNQFQCDVQKGIHLQRGWGNSNYGLSKLALAAATKIWAREEAIHGIKVNCCCPGYCNTDMSSHLGPKDPNEGAKNPFLLATMEDCPTGQFFEDLTVSTF